MKNDKICHFWAKPALWYRHRKWVPIPIGQRQVVPVPKDSGTGTQLQNGVGTGSNQSGTGTDASSNPDFCTLALLSPNSSTDSIGTLKMTNGGSDKNEIK